MQGADADIGCRLREAEFQAVLRLIRLPALAAPIGELRAEGHLGLRRLHALRAVGQRDLKCLAGVYGSDIAERQRALRGQRALRKKKRGCQQKKAESRAARPAHARAPARQILSLRARRAHRTVLQALLDHLV